MHKQRELISINDVERLNILPAHPQTTPKRQPTQVMVRILFSYYKGVGGYLSFPALSLSLPSARIVV